ncbi:MAG: PAS domain S-box protein, partial [Planctomycetes bacterium]|nr:PAS domain S-box protein [Planctomycetota bacterium]
MSSSAFENVLRLNQQFQETIAELRRVEKDLRESEERYHSLLASTTNLIWTTNAAGEVVDSIPVWRAFTGQTEEEVRGSGWLEAVHPEERGRARRKWAHAVTTRSIYEIQFRLRKYDGTYRHFSVRGVPVLEGSQWEWSYWQSPDFSVHGIPLVDDSNRIREWVGTGTDITDLIRAREGLISQAAELARSDEQFRVAREVQQKLYPRAAPALEGFDIAGACSPAEAAGGDYFDYIPMVGDFLGIVVGDASGHGVGSAMIMALTRAYLRQLAEVHTDVATILSHI